MANKKHSKKVEELITLTDVVKTVLEKRPKARDSDITLFKWVLNEYGYSVHTPFDIVADLMISGKVPTIDSMGRTRRKVQELFPELRPSKEAKEAKNRLSKEFKNYSHEVI